MIEIKSVNKGAELTSILFNGEEKLHDAKSYWNRHSPVLFPIVGKLKDNKTIIEGSRFEMGQHGFARDMEFEKISENSYSLKYNEKTLEKYPYKFELSISYEYTENSVITKYCVKNLDNKRIVFGLGAHPAYKCDYSKENHHFKFEKIEDEVKILELDDGLISNKKVDVKQYIEGNRINLKENTFEKDAVIMKNLKSEKITLFENENKILEFSFKGFPYLALWSKKDAPFVCIEPWFNTADKKESNGNYEEKEDLIELEPQEKFESQYEVKFF